MGSRDSQGLLETVVFVVAPKRAGDKPLLAKALWRDYRDRIMENAGRSGLQARLLFVPVDPEDPGVAGIAGGAALHDLQINHPNWDKNPRRMMVAATPEVVDPALNL